MGQLQSIPLALQTSLCYMGLALLYGFGLNNPCLPFYALNHFLFTTTLQAWNHPLTGAGPDTGKCTKRLLDKVNL